MADSSPSPDSHNAVPKPDMDCPDRNPGHLAREVRDRIDKDQLHERSLQRHIIERSLSARTCRHSTPE